MIMFKAVLDETNPDVESVEITDATGLMVKRADDGRQERKTTKSHQYHETFDAAKAQVVDTLHERLRAAEVRAAALRGGLNKVRGIVNPAITNITLLVSDELYDTESETSWAFALDVGDRVTVRMANAAGKNILHLEGVEPLIPAAERAKMEALAAPPNAKTIAYVHRMHGRSGWVFLT